MARILVVDDERSVGTLIAGMLEKKDSAPVLVSNGQEALAQIEKQPPFDLVLSGITMDGGGGLALLERIRKLQPETPMVMVSAVHDVARAIAAMRLGAYDILLKPFDKEQLRETVRRGLDHRQIILQNSFDHSQLENLVAARTELLGQAMAELERSYDITLEALGDALDLKDAETEGHSKRVTAFTIALARAMGLKPQEIRIIARGAFLHDIGKMAIPDAILLKPGRLDAPEQFTMREHCARGYQMLHKIPFLREASEIVYSHQEHYDGAGYPRGLKRDEIPLGSRIFAVADTLDAITSDRPYRRANTFLSARREIDRCAGTQFDPRVVEIYLGMPTQLWEDLRSEITAHARRFSPFALAANNRH